MLRTFNRRDVAVQRLYNRDLRNVSKLARQPYTSKDNAMNYVKSIEHPRVLTRRALLRILGVGATIATVGGAGVLLQACGPARQRTTSSYSQFAFNQ